MNRKKKRTGIDKADLDMIARFDGSPQGIASDLAISFGGLLLKRVHQLGVARINVILNANGIKHDLDDLIYGLVNLKSSECGQILHAVRIRAKLVRS
jgi:hypothetical protein